MSDYWRHAAFIVGEEAGNFNLSVFVEVSDVYGAKTRQEGQVVVRPVVIDASAVSQFADAVDSDFESGDLAKGTGFWTVKNIGNLSRRLQGLSCFGVVIIAVAATFFLFTIIAWCR